MPFSISLKTKTTTTKHNLVFVRNKTTGVTEICRAHEISGPRVSHERIHFVGRDRRLVCRCKKANLHHRKVSYVSEESDRLSSSLERYMERNSLETCLIDEYWADKDQRRSLSSGNGSQRESHDEKTRLQLEGNSPEAYGRKSSSNSGRESAPSSYHSRGRRSRSNSDPTTVSSSTSRKTCSTETSSTRASKTGSPTGFMRLRSVPQDNPDIPPKVWQSARPSLWTPRCETESEVSTPLGSAFSPVASPATHRSAPCTQDELRTTSSRPRNTFSRPTFDTSSLHTIVSTPDRQSRWSFCTERPDPALRGQSYASPAPPPPYTETETTTLRGSGPYGLGIAELSSQRSRAELGTEPRRNRGRHTATLHHLEGRDLLH